MALDPQSNEAQLRRPSCLATSYRDIQMQIGQAMRLQYELPDEELPDQLFSLLMQVTRGGKDD